MNIQQHTPGKETSQKFSFFVPATYPGYVMIFVVFMSFITIHPAVGQLKLIQPGGDAERAYFEHNGKPLLSFGGGPGDGMFWLPGDAFNYKRWADWEADHGMNHSRDYLPMGWKLTEVTTEANGGSLSNIEHPFVKVGANNQYDLTKFNDNYWKRFRAQCTYLQSKGIVIHMLMINGWTFNPSFPADHNYKYSFWNPDWNVNSATNYADNDWKQFFYCVADNKTGMLALQEAWFEKLVTETADLDNVYYDLVHEMGDLVKRGLDWNKAKKWIDHMAMVVKNKYQQLQPNKPCILGMDTGGLDGGLNSNATAIPKNGSKTDWVFTRPYFDILIFGKMHSTHHAREWRKKYNKPYIGQESWDDNKTKWGIRCKDHDISMRKYFWKFMMAKSQQMDIYHKPRKTCPHNDAHYPLNYNPYGWNDFENKAPVLRSFWESVKDYPALWFNGSVTSGPGVHKLVLSSKDEAVVYLSSGTSEKNKSYGASTLSVKDLSTNNGSYTAKYWNPATGIIDTKTVTISNGTSSVSLPGFKDDIAIHFYKNAGSAHIPVEGVELDKHSLALTEGTSTTLSATVSPQNATDRSIHWSSSNANVATVAQGKVTAISPGTATITVTTHDGDKKDTCIVTVNAATGSDPLVSDLSIANGKAYTWFDLVPAAKMYIDRNYKFNDIPAYLQGQLALRTANNDKSSNVHQDLVTFTANKDIIVYIAYTDINTTLTQHWLNSANGWKTENETLSCTLAKQEATRYLKSKTYSNGATVRLKGNGSTSSTSSMYNVIVVASEPGGPSPIPVTGVALNTSNLTILEGGQVTLRATLQPANATDQAVSWSSDNPGVASVTGGQVTAISPGIATITVTTRDGNKKDQCTITVTPALGGTPLVSDLTVSNGKDYEWSTLSGDSKMYIDRNYKFRSIPAHLDGQQVLLTANNDKSSEANQDLVTFRVNKDVIVYVAYTNINTTLTNQWLTTANGWIPGNQTLSTSLPKDEATRYLKHKSFKSGATVRLQGNGSTSSASSMYNVIVVEDMNTTQTTSRVSEKEFVKIYPNPFTSRLTILNTKAPEAALYTMNGVLLRTFTLNTGARTTLNLQYLQAGVYIIKIGDRVYPVVKE